MWRSSICRWNQRVPELHMVDFTAWQGTRIVAPAMAALTQQGLCNLVAVCVRSCVHIVGDIPMIFTGAKYSCEPLPGAWYVRHDAWSPLRNTLWSQADDARAAFVAVMILPRWPRGEVTYWAQNKSHRRLVLCRRSHLVTNVNLHIFRDRSKFQCVRMTCPCDALKQCSGLDAFILLML